MRSASDPEFPGQSFTGRILSPVKEEFEAEGETIEIDLAGDKKRFARIFRLNLEMESDEDVNLEEFADEIEGWVLDELKAIGCDTAKSVLNLSVEDLVKRTDLEEETIKELIQVLKAEFE